LFLIQQLMV